MTVFPRLRAGQEPILQRQSAPSHGKFLVLVGSTRTHCYQCEQDRTKAKPDKKESRRCY